jgi:hypothetical protein
MTDMPPCPAFIAWGEISQTFSWNGLAPRSSLSLPPKKLGLQVWAIAPGMYGHLFDDEKVMISHDSAFHLGVPLKEWQTYHCLHANLLSFSTLCSQDIHKWNSSVEMRLFWGLETFTISLACLLSRRKKKPRGLKTIQWLRAQLLEPHCLVWFKSQLHH